MLGPLIRNFASRKKKPVLVSGLIIAGICFVAFKNIELMSSTTPPKWKCFCNTEQVINVTNTRKVNTTTSLNLTNIAVPTKSNTQEKTETKREATSAPMPNNYVDFKLVLPFIEPNLDPKQRRFYVVVVVNSAAKGEKHQKLRQAIRETWGNSAISQSGNTTRTTHPWKLFFSLGISDAPTENEAILKEAREYNDIIIGNFSDLYRNVVIKTFMAHFWAVTKLSCDYVLKTDDDVYVRVPGLISWLLKSGSPKEFFGGMVALNYLIYRDPSSQFYISEDQYPGKYWPPWCHGSYHVLSSDIIPNYIVYTYKRKPFATDDAYLGVAALDLGIKVIHIPGFTIEDANPRKHRSDQEMNDSLAIGHKITPDQMASFHEYYRKYNLS